MIRIRTCTTSPDKKLFTISLLGRILPNDIILSEFKKFDNTLEQITCPKSKNWHINPLTTSLDVSL
jgi:hypothetical protein